MYYNYVECCNVMCKIDIFYVEVISCLIKKNCVFLNLFYIWVLE